MNFMTNYIAPILLFNDLGIEFTLGSVKAFLKKSR